MELGEHRGQVAFDVADLDFGAVQQPVTGLAVPFEGLVGPDPPPRKWAWAQILLPGGFTAGLGVYLIAHSNQPGGSGAAFAGVLSLLYTAGFVTHGIFSLLRDDSPAQSSETRLPLITMAPTDGGALAMLRWTF